MIEETFVFLILVAVGIALAFVLTAIVPSVLWLGHKLYCLLRDNQKT